MNLVSFEKDPNFLGGWLLEAVIFEFISCNYDRQKNIVVVVMESYVKDLVKSAIEMVKQSFRHELSFFI